MQITVFGASGKVGRIIVQKALEKNINVVAFVRRGTILNSSKNLKVIVGDIYNISDVDNAIKGSDAVVSALGSWGTPKKDILTEGMKNIIPSMQKHGLKRIISLTGADATVNNESSSVISKLSQTVLKLFAKKILQDGQNHIQHLMDSKLDWTVVRSPVMNEKGSELDYTLTKIKPMPWTTINRNSVALSMIELLKDHNFAKQAPYIKRV